jgi:hypothetical protein
MNVGKLVLRSTSTHECGSTGTQVGVLVLRSTSTHECGSTGTRVGVLLVLFTYFWPMFKHIFYLGVADITRILEKIPSSHFQRIIIVIKSFWIEPVWLSGRTPLGRYSNSVLIITLAYQYASYYRGVLVRYCYDTIGLLVRLYVLQRRVITKVSIHTLIITLAYQYACFYSGVLVVCTRPF